MIRRPGAGANRREGVRVANATPWTPSTLGSALTWWQNESSLVGSPITSITNLGGAGGSLSAAGAARATVATVASKSVPAYNGTSSVESAGPATSAIVSASAYSVCAVVVWDALTGTPTGGLDAASLMTVSGGDWYPLIAKSTGIFAGHFSGTDKFTPAISISTGVPYYVEVTYNGTTITLKANGSTQTVAAGSMPMLAGSMLQGCNYAVLAFAQGKVCEALVSNTTLSAGALASAAAYLRGRWGAT